MTYKEWKEKYVDNSDESGIIKERGKKEITPITDRAIEGVPRTKINGYTDKQCAFIQEQHKELLKYARENNDGKEVAFVFRKGLIGRTEYIGSDDSLDFGMALAGKGNDIFVMHNHPRNSGFSDTDIAFLLGNDSIKVLSVVKNNGSVETLSKTAMYDKEKIVLDFKRQYKKYVKIGLDHEIDKAVQKLLRRNKEGLEWTRN